MLQEIRTNYKDGFRISISDTGSGGLTGGKGGKGSASSIQENPNTVRSKAYVKLLCALSEGRVRGFGDYNNSDPLKAIYLDQTPIKNADGSLNFKDVLIDYRLGTQEQDYIAGVASDIEREINVGVQLKQVNGASVRTITDSNVNAVRLRFMFPAMRTISEDQKTIGGASVEFSIKLNGVEVQRPVVNEKSTSPFELANFHIPLTGSAPWNLSVTRITADSNTDRVQNDLYWQGYTEIIDSKLRYPNTALLFVQIDAEQFSSIPRLSVAMYGIECLIPHNYNPQTRVYNGFFNGSLVSGWTDNPAWILYDLITNSRYGLGERISRSLINVATFYSAAQYCDELVPDGFGGLEPRFRLNAYITTQDDAIKLLEDVCSVFRSMPYSYGGTIELSQDRPRAITKLFSPSNVISEDDQGNAIPPFTYSSSALETRHTAAYVSWSNPANFWADEQVYYEDQDAIQRYGFNPIEARGFGITSRGQAYRYARWLVEIAQSVTNTVTFRVGTEGDLIKVGEAFAVANPLKMQKRYYGRVQSGSSSEVIYLDAPISLNTNERYTITLWNPTTNNLEQRSINQPQIQSQIISVTPNFSFNPPNDTVYTIDSNVLVSKQFQCISIVEDGAQFEITGIDYFGYIYDTIDNDTEFNLPTVNSGFANLKNPVERPSNLSIVESLYQALGSGGIKIKVDISWSPSTSPWITGYQFSYKKSTDPNYTILNLGNVTSYTIEDAEPLTYDFRVVAVNGLGAKSQNLEASKQIQGLTIPPNDVTNLSLVYYENYALLSWSISPDLDVRIGGSYKIKFSNKTSNVSWADGVDITTISGSNTSAQLPLLSGTFMIKAVDSTGTYSQNAALILANNAPQINNYKNHIDITESPSFTGVMSNVVLSGGSIRLATDNLFDSKSGLWDSATGLFDDGGIDPTKQPTVVPYGTYTFASPVDLGSVATVRIVSRLSAVAILQNELLDDASGLWDSREGLFDGTGLDQASVKLQISVSQDASTYEDWKDFIIGDYLGRAFRFRAVLQSNDAAQNIVISDLGVTVFLPERLESGNFTTTAGSATVRSFTNAFLTTPQVSLSILNAQSGDRIESVSVTATNFTTTIRDSSNTIVSRSVAYFAQGFGKS